MRLRLLLPSLVDQWSDAAQIIKALETASIKTTYELLFAGLPEVIYGRIPTGLITFDQFTEFREQIALLSSAQGENGLEAYRHEVAEEEARIGFGGETGVEELDELVANAFGAYGAVELSGSATPLVALWIVLRYLALHESSSAWWIDTTTNFSVNQAAAITRVIHPQGASTIMDRLQISSAINLTAVHDVLDALSTNLNATEQDSMQPAHVRYVVIASVNSLFPFSASTSQGHAILTTFMRQISSMARQHRFTVIVINDPVSSQPTNPMSLFSSTVTKPGLGPAFTYLCDHTIWFANAEDVFGEHDATLIDLRKNMGDGKQVHIAEVLRSRNSVRFHFNRSYAFHPSIDIIGGISESHAAPGARL
ncbi:hypothetical protein FRB95_007605 [Tulasnella sp. JGI-2019a]|nr:hypothetical protein FRB95_007605 [Tulasnella sp. JGI-2019a]